MSYDFKRLGEVPEVEEVPEDSKVLINDEDEIKQIAFEKIAHASGGAIPCLCIYEITHPQDDSELIWQSNVPIIEVQNAIAINTPVLVYYFKNVIFHLMLRNTGFESWESGNDGSESWESGFYISPKFITETQDGDVQIASLYVDIYYSSSDDTEGTWEYE